MCVTTESSQSLECNTVYYGRRVPTFHRILPSLLSGCINYHCDNFKYHKRLALSKQIERLFDKLIWVLENKSKRHLISRSSLLDTETLFRHSAWRLKNNPKHPTRDTNCLLSNMQDGSRNTQHV